MSMSRIATSLPYTELEVADGNFDTSRSPIDRVVIHTMVGTWQGAAARFANSTQQVSAHYGVKLDGGLIHWLEETFTAYHAGNYVMNQRSIGIEHEDGGDYNGVRPDVLYESSAKLVADICTFYNIPIDRNHIIKHNQVIATGCPDALDVDRIVNRAKDIANPPKSIPQLEGLSKEVGYNPDHLGQTVSVNGITYQSISTNNVLTWQVVPSTPQTPVETLPGVPQTTISTATDTPTTTASTNPPTTGTMPPVVITAPIPIKVPKNQANSNLFIILQNVFKLFGIII